MLFSRLVSLNHPEVLEEGMVFALETYWPSADGWGAARIAEEVVVTADGCEVITKFPAEDLLVAGQRYYTVSGPLSTERDSQSPSTPRRAEVGSGPDADRQRYSRRAAPAAIPRIHAVKAQPDRAGIPRRLRSQPAAEGSHESAHGEA